MAKKFDVNSIRLASRKKPIQAALSDDRLNAHRKTVLSGEIVLLPCWNKDRDQRLGENPEMEGTFLDLHNEAVLDEKDEKITFSVDKHFHNPLYKGKQVINQHCYMEKEAIVGESGDFVVAEMMMEKVQKLWTIFHLALEIIIEGKFSALLRLEKVLAEVKVVMDRAAKSLYAHNIEDIEKHLSAARAMAAEAFAENCEDLAEKAELEFKGIFELLKFHSEVFPISYYSVSKERFLEALKSGQLKTIIFRPDEIKKDDDIRSFVQENPFKNAATTIAVRDLTEDQMEKVLNRLYLMPGFGISKKDIQPILADLYPSDKEILPKDGFAATGE